MVAAGNFNFPEHHVDERYYVLVSRLKLTPNTISPPVVGTLLEAVYSCNLGSYHQG